MKTVLQYAVLVGASIIVILGILHVGRNLKAPASVGGRWTLQVTKSQDSDPACDPLSSISFPPELLISQSGPELVLTINNAEKITYTGKLDGLKINARSNHEPAWQFVAEIDRQVEPDQLSGSLRSDECAAAIELKGIRLPHQTSLTGEH
jgi:hypothetical protein